FFIFFIPISNLPRLPQAAIALCKVGACTQLPHQKAAASFASGVTPNVDELGTRPNQPFRKTKKRRFRRKKAQKRSEMPDLNQQRSATKM
ncbi:MAG TPA: hypothetical protein PKN33_13395, partial [Phycisphaerae bacterium]|nr:hypothetical protein [Phycisphaerae bacterium]